MYYTVCKKHCTKHPQNNAEVFSANPSGTFKHSTNTQNSKVHKAAVENELVQTMPCVHREFTKKSEQENIYLERAFSVTYFFMKNFIANAKFEPQLQFIEYTCGDETLKHEILITTGETVVKCCR